VQLTPHKVFEYLAYLAYVSMTGMTMSTLDNLYQCKKLWRKMAPKVCKILNLPTRARKSYNVKAEKWA